ncbi:unnamed protein product [Ilex paraguariensis]|uniref:Late embryogenesis abundant protein LEA-2 subgroup domain-containing protein n=1 Tax=Ilex paraguariensis TaxID=185542 RepID=A0ABC8UUD7_9AQUA
MNDQHSRPVTGYPAATPAQPSTNPNGYSTTNTAYPYVAPPPPHHPYYAQNPYYHQQNPYAAQRATFIRRIFAVIIAAFIITGTIIFIVWLILRPRLPEFRVGSVAVSNFNLSSSTSLISGNWDVGFTVRNPNKKIKLYYDHIDARVFHGSDSLAATTVPPFYQTTRNMTTIKASFAASGAYVDRRVVDGINSERNSGSVSFDVSMVAMVRFKAGAWRPRRRFLRVFCGDLRVGLTGNGNRGSLIGGASQCRVGI